MAVKIFNYYNPKSIVLVEDILPEFALKYEIAHQWYFILRTLSRKKLIPAHGARALTSQISSARMREII